MDACAARHLAEMMTALRNSKASSLKGEGRWVVQTSTDLRTTRYYSPHRARTGKLKNPKLLKRLQSNIL